jgi:hypothetical protein
MEVKPDPSPKAEPAVKSAKCNITKNDVSKFLHTLEQESFIIFVPHCGRGSEVELRHKGLTILFPL